MTTQLSPDMFDGTYRVPDFAGLHGRIKLVGPDGTRDMVIDDGLVTITPQQKPPDCTLTAFERFDLVRLISGELNLVTSLLQGRIEAEGDPVLVVKIAGSMPEVGRQLPKQPQDRS